MKQQHWYSMPKYLIIIFCLTLFSSCHFVNTDQKEKGFYETFAGWDIRHVPIIPPFRATSVYPGEWSISGPDDLIRCGNKTGDEVISGFGVTKNHVYGTTAKLNREGSGIWFLFDTKSKAYVEYTTEADLDSALAYLQLEKNPIETCEIWYASISDTNRPYWFPAHGKDYPEYPDTRLDSCITLDIRATDKGIDFKVPKKIKKVNSRIYYFKLKFNLENNDRYFISFDDSYSRLIKNDVIMPAVSSGGNAMEISVYIPFGRAKEKGIKEEDRIVLSKLVDLK